MQIISIKCPHCALENTAASIVSSVNHPNNSYVHTVFCYCRSCYGGICMEVTNRRGDGTAPEHCDSFMKSFIINKVYPEDKLKECPKYCPVNIENYYMQASDNVERKNYDAAGIMFRKVIDVVMNKIGASPELNLKKRIDQLASSNVLTKHMAEWAHQIRLDGNDAAHEEEPFTKESAEALQGFTELLLMYIFTLPVMLDARKGAATSPTSA